MKYWFRGPLRSINCFPKGDSLCNLHIGSAGENYWFDFHQVWCIRIISIDIDARGIFLKIIENLSPFGRKAPENSFFSGRYDFDKIWFSNNPYGYLPTTGFKGHLTKNTSSNLTR